MKEIGIIGRKHEIKIIKNYLDSGKAELVAVYGRRRVGKTFLIKSVFNNQFDFAFTGMYNAPRAVQLMQFRNNLEQYSRRTLKQPQNWFEAFDALRHYLETLKKDKIVVFLDEIPWMDTPKSNFLSAFSQFWNDWGSMKSNFKLFVCGSATTWMLSKFIGDKGGLYGRVSRPIWLAPFTLAETEQFLRDFKGIVANRHEVAKAYMVLGGIPFYLDMLSRDMPLDANIDELFFAQGAPLRHEFDFLFRSLFNESKVYHEVVEALATKLKGLTRQQILHEIKQPEGGMLTEVLENLIRCDFVRKYTTIGKTGRDAMYQLTDLFSLFHYKFVENHNGQDKHLWSKLVGRGQVTAWSGYAFEQVCLHHVEQIKETLGIGGVITNVHSWSCRPFTDKDGTAWKGGQVDLVIDRADQVINLCEIKYAANKYTVTAEYEERLRERAALFARVTKTKKAICHTFITTYGVASNLHSPIVQSQVTLDDLFK